MIVEVTDADVDWLKRAEAVHRQLRPQLPADYLAKMQRVFADGGRMSLAVDGEAVVGIGVYRIYENTFDGLQLYLDDLVTDENRRSRGVGKQLMDHLAEVARKAGCVAFNLDSGVQRAQAHRFYFREGWTVSAFHFDKPL